MPARIAQNLMSLLWLIFFLWLLNAGQSHLARLLHPRLWWLLGCSALLFALFILVDVCSAKPPGPTATSLWWRWPFYAILFIPLMYLIPFCSARLQGDTFTRLRLQQLNTQSGLTQDPLINPERSLSAFSDPSDPQIPLTRLYAEGKQYLGKEIEVVCQILTNDQLPHGFSLCYRFRISCCAADAQPVFIFLQPSKSPISVANDTWVRVRGVLTEHQGKGFTVPLLQIQHLDKVPEPKWPFLF